MSDPSANAVALARMRAAGSVPVPDSRQILSSWEEQATRAGRQLVNVSNQERPPSITLGWVAGSEPVAGGDSGVERTKPSQVLLLTFASALRACWADRSEHPFPGVTAQEEKVLEAVASLGPLTTSAIEGGEGGYRHRKGALRRLNDANLLDITGATIRLGPAVATWSDGQIAVLRAVYDLLPTPPQRESGEPT